MNWNLICPICSCVIDSFRALKNLNSHCRCTICHVDLVAALDDMIAITFTVSPSIRRIAYHDPGILPAEDYLLRYASAPEGLIPDGTPFAKVKEKLMALKPQIRMLWTSEDDWNKAMQANQFDVATYWVSAVWRAQRKFNLPVELVIPKEGVIGWFDGLTVAKDAPHPDVAQQFIDFMVSPEFYVKWETDVGAPISANAAADAQLPASDPSKALVADKAVMDRVHFVRPISDERKKEFQEMWDEVKAYYAK